MKINHTIEIRSRYAETDQMGVVYYGNYLTYFEVGRVEFLRDLGLDYKSLEEEYSIVMPVVRVEIDYIRPITYDEVLELTTQYEKIDQGFIYFSSTIVKANGKLATKGTVKLCFVQKDTWKRVPVPEIIINLINGSMA